MAVACLVAGDDTLDTHATPPSTLPEPFHQLLEYAVLASETDPHDPMEQAFHHMAGTQLTGTETTPTGRWRASTNCRRACWP